MSACIAVASDLHLEVAGWRDHPTLWGDSYYGLQQLVDRCMYEHVTALALLGDIFNAKHPDPHTVFVCFRELSRLQEADISVYFLQGQHELARLTPWLRAHPWPRHMHRRLVVDSPIVFYGLDWLPHGMIADELKKVPADATVLFTHQVWKEMWNSPIVPGECTFKDVPGHIKVLVSGDYHKHFSKQFDNAGGTMLVGSPGSTCLQSVNEEPNKAFFLLEHNHQLTSMPLLARQVFEADVRGRGALDTLTAAPQVAYVATLQVGVPDHIGVNILRVTYDPTTPGVVEKLNNTFRGKVHLFLNPQQPEKKEIKLEREHRRACVSGGFTGTLDLVVSPTDPVNKDLRRLFNTNVADMRTELTTMQAEFVANYKKGQQGDNSQPETV